MNKTDSAGGCFERDWNSPPLGSPRVQRSETPRQPGSDLYIKKAVKPINGVFYCPDRVCAILSVQKCSEKSIKNQFWCPRWCPRFWHRNGLKIDMAEFKYYPVNPNHEMSSLCLYVRWKNNTLKHSPGISIKTHLWDQDNQKLKLSKGENFIEDTNAELSAYRTKIEKCFVKLKTILDREPTVQEMKDAIRELTGKVQVKTETVFSHWEKHSGVLEAEFNATGKATKQNSNASSHQQTIRLLKEMLGRKSGTLNFEEVNGEFYARILNYCSGFKNHGTNNIGKHIKNLKTFMEEARKQGLHTNMAYKDFKVLEEEVHAIALTRSELDSIYNLDLSGKNAHLKPTRDLFIIASSTGLRYGDWSQLVKADLSGNTVRIVTEKTKEPVVIPLSKRVKMILSQYEGEKLPIPKTNQPTNRELKEICKLAGIHGKEQFYKTRGGRSILIELDRWEMVSTHTARRSFATNLYLQWPRPYEIMKITGHKTEAKFLKYIQISKDDAAKRMLEFID